MNRILQIILWTRYICIREAK